MKIFSSQWLYRDFVFFIIRISTKIHSLITISRIPARWLNRCYYCEISCNKKQIESRQKIVVPPVWSKSIKVSRHSREGTRDEWNIVFAEKTKRRKKEKRGGENTRETGRVNLQAGLFLFRKRSALVGSLLRLIGRELAWPWKGVARARGREKKEGSRAFTRFSFSPSLPGPLFKYVRPT